MSNKLIIHINIQYEVNIKVLFTNKSHNFIYAHPRSSIIFMVALSQSTRDNNTVLSLCGALEIIIFVL